jgi:hypothetical protein
MLMIGGPANGQDCESETIKVMVPHNMPGTSGFAQLFYEKRLIKSRRSIDGIECYVFNDTSDFDASTLLDFHILNQSIKRIAGSISS